MSTSTRRTARSPATGRFVGTAGARLTLRHTVAGRGWIPKATAGWHLCLMVAERLLDGQPIDPIRRWEVLSHGWADLNEAYAVRFGIPATGLPDAGA